MKSFRVYLRALEPDDYRTSIHWRRDDAIWQSLTGPKYFVSEAMEKQWVEKKIFDPGNDLVLAICLNDTHEHIGYVYLNGIDMKNRSASSGKLIGVRAYWSKGYGTEATLLMLYHAFMVLGLERVESRSMVGNTGGIRSTEKIGYHQEGILRRAVYKDGAYRDINVMSILRDEFISRMDAYDWGV